MAFVSNPVAEATQRAHASVGLTPNPVQLRGDSGGANAETPGSGGKMISLIDLHVNSAGQVSPADMADAQAVNANPLDPLLQILVQDRLFVSAVKTSQLHVAGAAAVKVLRAHLPSAHSELKRPGDRRNGAARHASLDGYDPHGRGAGYPRPHGAHHLAVLGPALCFMRQDVLHVEDNIPWTSVRRTWRNKRTAWRRQVKATELVAELAARLKELRYALLADDATFIGCGQTWRLQLESCAQGRGSAALLVSVWDEMKNTIRSWLGMTDDGGRGAAVSGVQAEAGAARAVQALQGAVRQGSTDALLQAPLESIVGNDSLGLHTVRQAIELERRIVATRLASLKQNIEPATEPMASYFTSISAPWDDSDAGGGGRSEMENGSEATDVDSDFDA